MIVLDQLDLQNEPISDDKNLSSNKPLEDKNPPYGKCLRSVTRFFRGDANLASKRIEMQALKDLYEERSRLNLQRCPEDDEYERALFDFVRLEEEAWGETKIEGVRDKYTKPKKDRDRPMYWAGVAPKRKYVKLFSLPVPDGGVGFVHVGVHTDYEEYIPARFEVVPIGQAEHQAPPLLDRFELESPFDFAFTSKKKEHYEVLHYSKEAIAKIPTQPENLRAPGRPDLSYYDYRKGQWVAERTFGIPYKKDTSQQYRPFVSKNKELVIDAEFELKHKVWRERHGHQKEGVWVFNEFSEDDKQAQHFQNYYQPKNADGDLNHDNTDGSKDLVAAIRRNLLKDNDGEKYNEADAYVIGFNDVFMSGNEGVPPLEGFTCEREDTQKLYGDDGWEASSTAPRVKGIAAGAITEYHEWDWITKRAANFLRYSPGAVAEGRPPQIRSPKAWKKFDALSKKRCVNDLHETNRYGVYPPDPGLMLVSIMRSFPGTRRACVQAREPVPAYPFILKNNKIKPASALLLPPIPTLDEKQAQMKLQKEYDNAVARRLLLDVECQDHLIDAAFEAWRREAETLKQQYEEREIQGLHLCSEDYDYQDSSDWYEAMADPDSDIMSPSVGRDLGRCSYRSELRDVYFSLHHKGSASKGSDGSWYDYIFPAPKEKKKSGVSTIPRIHATTILRTKRPPKGIKTTVRLIRGTITEAAAARAEGEKRGTVRKRRQRLEAELKQQNASYDFQRLSSKDLFRAMVDRGFYVVLPGRKFGKVQFADELISVDVAGPGAFDARYAGLLGGFPQDEILGGLQMEMSRALVREHRAKKSRKADQDLAIRSAQKRLHVRFESARLLYFGAPLPAADREALRIRLRKLLPGTTHSNQ